MKKNYLGEKYFCYGEDYNHYTRIGFVGEVHTLGEWLEVLFPNEEMSERFKDTKPEIVLGYIEVHRRKQLSKV